MQLRTQDGIVEQRGRGKHKYYCGRYSTYITDENGRNVRRQPRPFLGYCDQMSRSEAFDRLQQLIREDQIKRGLIKTGVW